MTRVRIKKQAVRTKKPRGRKNKRLPLVNTPLKRMLKKLNISQLDLQYLIYEKFPGTVYGLDRISRIVNGRKTNLYIKSYLMIAEALKVPIEEIIDKQKILEDDIL